MEQIKLFMEKAQTDETLRFALKELAEQKASLDDVIALAAAHGFIFTKENWETAAKELAPAGELSEEQLAAVGGGDAGNWILWSISTAVIGCVVSGIGKGIFDECFISG